MADTEIITTAEHLHLAAFHLYEACREHTPQLVSMDDPDSGAFKLDAEYRAAGAHRRGYPSIKKMLIERTAGSLAVLDGQCWPGCDKGLPLDLSPLERNGIAATRRQRYRHIASQIMWETFTYLEQGGDTEPQRQLAMESVSEQRIADIDTVRNWKNQQEAARMARPSIAKGCEL